jgi:uncharacterized protein YbaP (TraB family)
MSRFKVWAIAAQIPMIDHLAELANGTPLDMQLSEAADADGKDVGALETVDEQIEVFDELDAGEQNQLLSDALDELDRLAEEGDDPMEKIIRLYVAGDAEALMELLNETESSDEELQRKLEDRLLWQRNRRMADRIAEHLRGAPERSFFFAVGAAHMPDDRGVVALLRGKGFRLTRQPESASDIEARILELEAELARQRERLKLLRKAG